MSDKIEGKKIAEPLVMTITAKPGEPMQVEFPFLPDKVASYGFLKMAEKTLDAHYNQKEKHGIKNFVNRIHK